MMSSPMVPTTQLVNFCRAPLTKHVECTSVCADDHSPENLVSNSEADRQRGFRVERFVRPPVHVEFHFLAPINVACVLIKPDLVGEGSAASLIVSVATSSQQHQLVQVSRGTVRGEGAMLLMRNRVYERRHSINGGSGRMDLNSFSRVLGSRLTQGDTLAVVPVEETLKDICNIKLLRLTVNFFSGPRPVSLRFVEVWGTLGASGFREERLKVHLALAQLGKATAVATPRAAVAVYGTGCVPSPLGGLTECQLCHQPINKQLFSGGTEGERQRACSAVTDYNALSGEVGEAVELENGALCPSCQRGASDSCYPCPGQSVQSVWSLGAQSKLAGGGSVCATQHTAGELNFSSGTGPTSFSDLSGDTGNNSRSRSSSTTVSVPDRYLDEITCEIMILPMLLPSGHYVDRSTLDKLSHTDTLYGRPPSDPFTGVAFSECAEPQFSVELKQQIDSFMSRHRSRMALDNTSSLMGQTLGSAADIALHLSSTVSGARVGLKRGRGDGALCSDQLCLPPPSKRISAKGGGGEGSSPLTTPAASSVSRDTQERSRTTGAASSLTHELELASSLDRELHDLLHK